MEEIEKVEKILVDFDGVIHDELPLPGYQMGQPVEGSLKALQELSKYYEIIVFTARDNSNNHVTKWLRFFHVPYSRVTNYKEDAAFYIDDKGIRFETWEKVLYFIRICNGPQKSSR